MVTATVNCFTVSPGRRMPFMKVPHVASTLSLSSSSDIALAARHSGVCHALREAR